MRVEYYRIEGMMETESTLKDAKITAKEYIKDLEKEDEKPLTDEELEEVYISGINKGETITLTKIIRKSNREHFGDETLYTSDAENMLKKGQIKILSPLVGELVEYFATATKEQIEKDYEEIQSMFESSKSSPIKDFFNTIKKMLNIN